MILSSRLNSFLAMTFLIDLIFPLSVSAFNTTFDNLFAQKRAYLSASAGMNMLKLGINTHNIIYHDQLLNDQYSTRHQRSADAGFGVQSGYEFQTSSKVIPSVSLSLGFHSNLAEFQYKGRVLEQAFDDPNSNILSYRFVIKTLRFMIETQLNWEIKNFMPFISMGIGSAWTKTFGYNERATDDIGYPPLPPFHSHMNKNLSYELGFGLGYNFNTGKQDNELLDRIAIGYRFVDLGRISFGDRGNDYPYKLLLGCTHTQEIYLSYYHFFA